MKYVQYAFVFALLLGAGCDAAHADEYRLVTFDDQVAAPLPESGNPVPPQTVQYPFVTFYGGVVLGFGGYLFGNGGNNAYGTFDTAVFGPVQTLSDQLSFSIDPDFTAHEISFDVYNNGGGPRELDIYPIDIDGNYLIAPFFYGAAGHYTFTSDTPLAGLTLFQPGGPAWNYGIDNVAFNEYAPTAETPEPSSVWLCLAGLAAGASILSSRVRVSHATRNA